MACLTTMPKQSNKISHSIYIFDRTPWIILRNKNSFLLFCFNSYPLVCPFCIRFGCLVLKSSLWWHLRQQERVYWKKQKLYIHCMCVHAHKIHDTFVCLFWILSQCVIWWKLNKVYKQFKLSELLITYFFVIKFLSFNIKCSNIAFKNFSPQTCKKVYVTEML